MYMNTHYISACTHKYVCIYVYMYIDRHARADVCVYASFEMVACLLVMAIKRPLR